MGLYITASRKDRMPRALKNTTSLLYRFIEVPLWTGLHDNITCNNRKADFVIQDKIFGYAKHSIHAS